MCNYNNIIYLWTSRAVTPERSRGGVAVSAAASEKRVIVGGVNAVIITTSPSTIFGRCGS